MLHGERKGKGILMYRRAKPTVAQQSRADNGSPSQNRGPATTTAPASSASARSSIDHASAAGHSSTSAPNPASLSGSGSNIGNGTAPATASAAAPDYGAAGTVRSSLLQPRVAVVLGVSKTWYPLLFACRLVSIAPGVLFGLPTALRLLAMLHLMYLGRGLDSGALGRLGRGAGAATTAAPLPTSGYDAAFEARLRLTETLLASIWVCHPFGTPPNNTPLFLPPPYDNNDNNSSS